MAPPARSLRMPSRPGGSSSPPAPPPDRPSLRLAVAKGTLGIELDLPFQLGPLLVEAFSIALEGLKFPVDLSGGVSHFRHRRGRLVAAKLSAKSIDLARWAAPKLRGVLGDAAAEIVIAPALAGVMIGVTDGTRALAFDALIAPNHGDVRVLPERARGIGLGAPPHALALRVLAAIAQGFAKPAGGVLVVDDAMGELARELLPSSGARAPSTEGFRLAPLDYALTTITLDGALEGEAAALDARALSALELAEIAGEADQLAFAGELDRARAAYLDLLERMPRHPEIARRIAWIDSVIGDRAEAALATLSESTAPAFAGLLGGQLLSAVGDEDGALAAFSQAAEEESYGPLAALTLLEIAKRSSLEKRLDALDRAVTRAPSMERARWARLEARLDVADLRGALGEAEHLEALARGSHAKHEAWRRAADLLLARGLVADAVAFFERALRFAPDSAEAVAGLARSLRAAGQSRRALDLFARALALADKQKKEMARLVLDHARSLVEVAEDRPAAIARARSIGARSEEVFEARFLEGRWRAELGDVAGAGLAFGKLRDAVEIAKLDGDRVAVIASLLFEAAAIEERDRNDVVAAQRDLGLALRLRPRDRQIAAAFRRVASQLTASLPPSSRPSDRAFPAEVAPTLAPPAEVAIAMPSRPPPPSNPIADEARVDSLSDKLRGNPNDEAVANELADLLERLGRDLDLVALLSARIDEGDEAARAHFGPKRREALRRLAGRARDEGRSGEADLYDSMAAQD